MIQISSTQFQENSPRKELEKKCEIEDLLVNHFEAELDEDDAGSRAAEDDEEDGQEGVHAPHSAPRGGRPVSEVGLPSFRETCFCCVPAQLYCLVNPCKKGASLEIGRNSFS